MLYRPVVQVIQRTGTWQAHRNKILYKQHLVACTLNVRPPTVRLWEAAYTIVQVYKRPVHGYGNSLFDNLIGK